MPRQHAVAYLAVLAGIAALLAGALTLASPSTPANAAPNLVTNGAFNTDVAGWTGFETFTWTSADAGGSASSGSLEARITPPASPGFNSGGVQCVAVTGGLTYEYSGDIRIPSAGQPATAVAAGLLLTEFDGPNCTGTQLDSDGISPGVTTKDDIWYHRSGSVSLDPLAVSVWIYLNISGEADVTTQAHANFDNIAFSQGPLDTPTPLATNTPIPSPTNTPGGATNTPTTAANTSTPTRTNTPAVTSTPASGGTPIPAITATTAGGGAGAGGVQPPNTGGGPGAGNGDAGGFALAIAGAALVLGGAAVRLAARVQGAETP